MSLKIEKYSPPQQGSGQFDGGKIKEVKPIPFPHESGGSKRIGPLLYWAWASARGDGIIGMHPHKGFEIISYVLKGSIGHTDSFGNNKRVHQGSAQVMKTGAGISHQEEMYGEQTDFFQIWFEPNLAESLHKKAVYLDIQAGEFVISKESPLVSLKNIVGKNAPIQLDSPIKWVEIQLDPNGYHFSPLEENSFAAMVQIEGESLISFNEQKSIVQNRDFLTIQTSNPGSMTIESKGEKSRIALITGPIDPGYPLSQY